MSSNPNIIQKFNLEEERLLDSRSKLAIVYLAPPLILSFSLVDFIYVPNLWSALLLIRLSVLPAVAIYVVLRKWFKLPLTWSAHYFCLFLGAYTALLVAKTGFEASAYYAGFNLVGIVALLFMPWTPRHLVLNLISIYIPYIVVLALKPGGNYDLGLLITSVSFCFSTVFLCSICWYSLRKLRFKEFLSRREVLDLIAHQEEVIRLKTKESVQLHKLSRQFSDETIQLVKDEAINLDARERRFITCIFVDIEGSSSKSNIIDHREYLDLLDSFFNVCTDIFVKYNITVGTFLGDGLLAFSNAPVDVDQSELRATQACLEILEKRKVLNEYFRDTWRSEFNIRIGISSGYCYCGFFPSGTKGNYSVNGVTVNLSSRLCDAAPSNTICTTKDFLISLESIYKNIGVEKLDSNLVLKGFEGCTPTMYIIKNAEGVSTLKIDAKLCPLCHSSVVSNSDNSGFDLVKCTSCEYTDLVDPSNDEAA